MIKKEYEKLIASEEFKEWKSKNSDNYLVHVFMDDQSLEFGFYDKKKDFMTTFFFNEEDVVDFSTTDEIFKHDADDMILPLNIEIVQVTYKDALSQARSFLENEKDHKFIIVLQNLKIGQVWNVTLITNKFNVLNVKIASDSGKVLKHEKSRAFDFRADSAD